jgi:hypothetical protein
MRDLGILIWVGLLVVGVVGSMVSSIRRQMQAAQPGSQPSAARPQTTTRPQPPVRRAPTLTVTSSSGSLSPQAQALLQQMTAQIQQGRPQPAAAQPPPRPTPTRPPAAVPSPAPPEHHDPAHPAPAGHRPLIFRRRGDIVRAVIAAEVLGKPRAFGDEYLSR